MLYIQQLMDQYNRDYLYLLRLNNARSNSPGPTGLEGLGRKFFVPLSFSLLHEMADEREPSAFPGIFVAQFNQLF